ncbi:hypothetical protein B0T24DRAFT_670457 [Lasiosphaeria ovina]|uniref:Uncharacterized protein n=1 Tax=Lasiosphaeria ovina TaxID=92902 RepID=A0AAE0MZV3_9PEZI|nr:hypothetical protein B0T24DRAFT_670457 [Lasiosphaeria ovina]
MTCEVEGAKPLNHSGNEMLHHLSEVHDHPGITRCPLCVRHFSARGLDNHVRGNFKKEAVQCQVYEPKDGPSFDSYGSWYSHMEMAHDLQWMLARDLMSQVYSVIIDSTCNFPEVLSQGSTCAQEQGHAYWHMSSASPSRIPKALETEQNNDGTYLTVERIIGIELTEVGNFCRLEPQYGRVPDGHTTKNCTACQTMAEQNAEKFVQEVMLPQLMKLASFYTEFDRREAWHPKTYLINLCLTCDLW